MTDKMKRSLDFVVRFYRPGAFKPDGWFIDSTPSFWRRHAVAASVIGTALLAAAAVTTYIALHKPASSTPAPAEAPVAASTPEPAQNEIPTSPEIKKVVFDDASLPEVVGSIESTYGVKVSGNTSGQPNLTLSYEGTAEDLVATINDLLGTNLYIEQ